MVTKPIPDDYVRMAKCRFCGHDSGAILLNTRLKSIPKEQAFDPDPCDACKERFKTMVYFMGECGHNGFVKTRLVEEMVNDPELVKALLKDKIFRTEKCFYCVSGQDISTAEHI